MVYDDGDLWIKTERLSKEDLVGLCQVGYEVFERMHGLGISGEGKSRRHSTNPGSPGRMAVKMVCVCVCV